jgi:hypothetical protein
MMGEGLNWIMTFLFQHDPNHLSQPPLALSNKPQKTRGVREDLSSPGAMEHLSSFARTLLQLVWGTTNWFCLIHKSLMLLGW